MDWLGEKTTMGKTLNRYDMLDHDVESVHRLCKTSSRANEGVVRTHLPLSMFSASAGSACQKVQGVVLWGELGT